MKLEFKRGNDNEGYDNYFECVTNKKITLCVATTTQVFKQLKGKNSFVLNVVKRSKNLVDKTQVILTDYADWSSVPGVKIPSCQFWNAPFQILKDTNANFRKDMNLPVTKDVSVYIWFTNIS